MKQKLFSIIIIVLVFNTSLVSQKTVYNLYFDKSIPQLEFGIEELKIEMTRKGIKSSSFSISKFKESPVSIVIVIDSKGKAFISNALKISTPRFTKSQSYSIRKKISGKNTTIAILANDVNGAMYGALDIAEAVKLGTINELQDKDNTPYIEKRGLKFNIPLDMRSPTYSDKSDAAQKNIPEMWDMNFWTTMLDEMARYRFNVLSLWSLQPFPSMVKVPEFPNVALNDVWQKAIPYPENMVDNNGNTATIEMKDYKIVKKITIEEKIRFWQNVMEYGHKRGVSFQLFTWNIFTHGIEGKYGINNKQNNDTTIAYFRAATREMVLTYPYLEGIGITAGEHMQNLKGEYSNEKWLWKAYGEGVNDALKINPKRKVELIHRFHMASQKEILNEWKAYPGEFNFSFKYLYAHMYSDTKSVFIKPAVEMIAPGIKMWIEIRNDDIYSFRWGDADFAREFVKNIPPENKIAGYYMGPDGYCWGREFLSTEPETPRQPIISKQWLSFMMWGRLSFDPTIPNLLFKNTLAKRFTEVSSDKLYEASSQASKIFPEVTRLFWGDIDVRWFPEACSKVHQFYTIKDFIMQVSMPGTENINIKIWRDLKIDGKPLDGKTPLEVADLLEGYATKTLAIVDELRKTPSINKELRLTLGDYEAFAHIGNYYAEKIRGASYIALYDTTQNKEEQNIAINHLEKALSHWKLYAAIYTKQYVQPVLYGRAGIIDIPGKLTIEVAKDIEMARNWAVGTINGPLVGRKELNFKP